MEYKQWLDFIPSALSAIAGVAAAVAAFETGTDLFSTRRSLKVWPRSHPSLSL